MNCEIYDDWLVFSAFVSQVYQKVIMEGMSSLKKLIHTFVESNQIDFIQYANL